MANSVTTASPSLPTRAQTKPQTTHPPGSLRFDWSFMLLGSLLIAGLMIDGWAHYHNRTDNTFFTPWHFLFYSAFGSVALFLAYHQLRNIRQGYTFTHALPQGYGLSLVGAVIFALGGVGDLIWHTLFGIEGGSEALTSPTHLMLGVGMGLIVTGPVRSIWLRRESGNWRTLSLTLGPALIGSALFLLLLEFFTAYAHPFVNPSVMEFRRSSAQDAGVAAILLQSSFISGVLLLLVRRWHLPFGALTLVLTLSTGLITVLTDLYVLIPGAFLTGLIADLLVWRLHPHEQPGRFHLFAFIVPVLFFGFYMLTAQIVTRIGWSIHVWTGAVFLTGLIGLLLSYLMTLPLAPQDTAPPAPSA